MIGIRDEYAPTFGRQNLTLWEGAFLSDYVGHAHELPRGDGFMVTTYSGRKVRVSCPAPRTAENYQAVDEAIASAVRS